LRFWALDSGIPAAQTKNLPEHDIVQLILTVNGMSAPPPQVMQPVVATVASNVVPARKQPMQLANGWPNMSQAPEDETLTAVRPWMSQNSNSQTLMSMNFSPSGQAMGNGQVTVTMQGGPTLVNPTLAGSGSTMTAPVLRGNGGSSNTPVWQNPGANAIGGVGSGSIPNAGNVWGGSSHAPVWGGSGSAPVGPVRGSGSGTAPVAETWTSPAVTHAPTRSPNIGGSPASASPAASLAPPTADIESPSSRSTEATAGASSLTSILAKMNTSRTAAAASATSVTESSADSGSTRLPLGTLGGDNASGLNQVTTTSSRLASSRTSHDTQRGALTTSGPPETGGAVDEWDEVLRYLDLLMAVQTSEANSWATVRRYIELLRDYRDTAPKEPPRLSGGSTDSDAQSVTHLQTLRRQAAKEALSLDGELREALRQARVLQRECEQLNVRLSIERDEHAAMLRASEQSEELVDTRDEEAKLQRAAQEVETLQGRMLQHGSGLQPWQVEQVARLRREIGEAKSLAAACNAGSQELRARLEAIKRGSVTRGIGNTLSTLSC